MTKEQFERAERLNQKIQDKLDEVKKEPVENVAKIQRIYQIINDKKDELSDLLEV